MKMKFFGSLLALMISLFVQAYAQEGETVTEEEIRKYAVTMDSVAAMKETVKVEMKEMITGNKDISVKRYNELNNAIKDEAKLQELAATEEEITFVKSVADRKSELTAGIKTTLSTMAKEYMGGVKIYNKVKKAVKSDPEVKAKYEEILAELSEARSAQEEPAGN